MTSTISIQPTLTTTAGGSFSTTTEGYIQGTALNDPAVRNALAGGVLASTETLPMWGGVAIGEDVPTPSTRNSALGGNIVRASALAGITGFSVFDQNHAAIVTPTSEVALSASGMQVNFYRLKSGARIAVACDPSLISLDGGLITQQVSWDYVTQRLVPYSPAYGQATISNAVWASTGGGRVTLTVNVDYTSLLNAGDDINIANVVNTGGSGTDIFNGAFTVVSVPDATHVVVSYPAGSSPGTYASGGIVVAGGGALDVRVLEVQPEGNMTVDYDSDTGQASWNRDGAVAIILI